MAGVVAERSSATAAGSVAVPGEGAGERAPAAESDLSASVGGAMRPPPGMFLGAPAFQQSPAAEAPTAESLPLPRWVWRHSHVIDLSEDGEVHCEKCNVWVRESQWRDHLHGWRHNLTQAARDARDARRLERRRQKAEAKLTALRGGRRAAAAAERAALRRAERSKDQAVIAARAHTWDCAAACSLAARRAESAAAAAKEEREDFEAQVAIAEQVVAALSLEAAQAKGAAVTRAQASQQRPATGAQSSQERSAAAGADQEPAELGPRCAVQ